MKIKRKKLVRDLIKVMEAGRDSDAPDAVVLSALDTMLNQCRQDTFSYVYTSNDSVDFAASALIELVNLRHDY